jgi:hypothetical protein
VTDCAYRPAHFWKKPLLSPAFTCRSVAGVGFVTSGHLPGCAVLRLPIQRNSGMFSHHNLKAIMTESGLDKAAGQAHSQQVAPEADGGVHVACHQCKVIDAFEVHGLASNALILFKIYYLVKIDVIYAIYDRNLHLVCVLQWSFSYKAYLFIFFHITEGNNSIIIIHDF